MPLVPSGRSKQDNYRYPKQAHDVFDMAKTPTADPSQIPPASLTVLLSMLSTQALVALGKMPMPGSNTLEANMPLARHFIDTIEMLGEKTAGNRSDEETKLLEASLSQLRMLYVSETK